MKRKELLDRLDLHCFIAFDFETTGLDIYHDRIIELAAVKFEHGEITDRFVTLVNPEIHIPNFITDLTGITDAMVSDKPVEKMIVDDFLRFLGNHPIVAHNIHFDIGFLKSLCERSERIMGQNTLYDTLQLSRNLLFDQPVFNLGALSEYYGLSSDNTHRAESDTINTGRIFLELLDELSKYPLDVISKINSMVKGKDIPNRKLFTDIGNELIKKGDMGEGISSFEREMVFKSNIFSCIGNNSISDITSKEVFGDDGLLSKIHPNFEYRYNQEKYAEKVSELLNSDKRVGVIEAGTGLGKSMSYLFGAIKRSEEFETNGPTIIACHTKHLQDQLFYKDLPVLSKALDVPLKAVMLKGRKNYLCCTRMNWLISDSNTLETAEIEALLPIIFWMYWTKTGDISECSGFFNTRRNWLKSLICSDTGFCTTEICKNNDGCFYGKLKKSIFHAQLIVVNHSLLMTNLVQKGLLPEYESVIIDEAHNIVKSAYDQFKVEWSEQKVSYQLQALDPSFPRSSRWNNILLSLNKINNDAGDQRENLVKAISDTKDCLKILMKKLCEEHESKFNPENSYQVQPILNNIAKDHASIEKDIALMKRNLEDVLYILLRIKKIVLEIDKTRTDYPILHTAMEQGVEITEDLIACLVSLTENQDSDWVYWIEGEYKRSSKSKGKLTLSLFAVMIDISNTLNMTFFEKINSCILTSATLKVQNSFGYFLGRVGLYDIGYVQTKEFLSPFHYNEQVSYHQYGGAKEISNNPSKVADLIYEVHKKYNKRTMVLFTSINALSETAKILRAKPDGNDLPLFAQVRGASRPSIIKGMHERSNGILFGTNSFWEGVDLPGDLLEILIMVKLPFDVPTEPLVRSYANRINKLGGNSFIEYNLPEAIVKFRQGFGRLIRTSYDSGRFICLDNRIVRKRYGEIISQSLPIEMQTFSDIYSI